MQVRVQFAVIPGADPGAVAFKLEQWLKRQGIREAFSQLLGDDGYDMAAVLEVADADAEEIGRRLRKLLRNLDPVERQKVTLICLDEPAPLGALGPRARLSELAERAAA